MPHSFSVVLVVVLVPFGWDGMATLLKEAEDAVVGQVAGDCGSMSTGRFLVGRSLCFGLEDGPFV